MKYYKIEEKQNIEMLEFLYEHALKETFKFKEYIYISVASIKKNKEIESKFHKLMKEKIYKQINLKKINEKEIEEFDRYIIKVEKLIKRNKYFKNFKKQNYYLIKNKKFFIDKEELEAYKEYIYFIEKIKQKRENKNQKGEKKKVDIKKEKQINKKIQEINNRAIKQKRGYKIEILEEILKITEEKNKIVYSKKVKELLKITIDKAYTRLKEIKGENQNEILEEEKRKIEIIKKIKKIEENKEYKIFEFYKEKSKKQIFRESMLTKKEHETLEKITYKILTNKEKQKKEDIVYAFKYYRTKNKPELKKIYEKNKKETEGLIKNALEFLPEKRIKKENEKMLEIRKKLKELQNTYQKEWIVSIDLEFATRKNEKDIVYEIGYTLKNISKKVLIVKNYIVEENTKMNYKPFNQGVTKILKIEEIKKEMEKDFRRIKKDGGIIVGNGIYKDINLIKELGISTYTKKHFDLSELIYYIDKTNIQISLENILKILNITAQNLHNAGNDSYYSVRAFVKLLQIEQSNNQYEFIKKSINQKLQQTSKKNNKTNIVHKYLATEKKKKKIINEKEIENIKEYKVEEIPKQEYIEINQYIEILEKTIKNKTILKKILNQENIKNIQIIETKKREERYISIEMVKYLKKYIEEKIKIKINIEEAIKSIVMIPYNQIKGIEKINSIYNKQKEENIKNNTKRNNNL